MKRLFCLVVSFFLSFPVMSQNRYGLIIGTNYQGNKANIPELGLCEKDASYLKGKIESVGNFKEISILLGRQVTKDNIQREIKNLARKAKKDDTVFLYFSGHGTTQKDSRAPNGMRNFLVCFDRPHLSDEELNRMLEDIQSPKTLFVFDCCYSGGIAKKGQNTRGAGEIPIPQGSDGIVKQNSEDIFFQNKAIIASSDDNQTSIEVGGNINHGVFTYNFGRALESADLNNDKTVTALEAFFHAKDATVKMAKKFNHDQVPQVSGDASGIFLSGNLTPVPPQVVQSAPPPKPTPPPVAVQTPPPLLPTPPTASAPPIVATPPPIPEKPPETVVAGTVVPPPVVTTPAPEPTSAPPVPQPVSAPAVVTPAEPPAQPQPQVGRLLIKTTIVREKTFSGGKSSNPYDLLDRMKQGGKIGSLASGNKNEDRKIKVLLNDQEVAFTTKTVKSTEWGAISRDGKLLPGDLYHLEVNNLPPGVHKVTIKADDYPESTSTIGILPNQTNELDLVTSISGMGAIRGKVFYKTLDNPIRDQPIWMPTITSGNAKQKTLTDKDGVFWFTNLPPGSYEIRASFAEQMKLENADIQVKSGEVTTVDIILNVKLPRTKTKY